MQHINFTGNLNQGENINAKTAMIFLIEKPEGTICDFSRGTVEVFNTLNVKLSNLQLNKLNLESSLKSCW